MPPDVTLTRPLPAGRGAAEVAMQRTEPFDAEHPPIALLFRMMMTDDLLATLEKLDQQLVRLIADRRDMVAQIPGGLSLEQELEIMSLWIDEAAERELPEDAMEKLCKMLNAICRKRGE